MKNLSLQLFTLLSILFFAGCSSDNDSLTNSAENLNLEPETVSFLKEFYETDNLSIKKQKEITSIENKKFIVKQVSIEDENKNTGYVFLNKQSKGLSYFIDVDKQNKEVFTKNILTNEEFFMEVSADSKIFNDKFFEMIDENKTATSKGKTPGRFWGWSCGYPSDGERYCRYYAAGIPCCGHYYDDGNLPGSNPKTPKDEGLIK